jgi:hypothetical protein
MLPHESDGAAAAERNGPGLDQATPAHPDLVDHIAAGIDQDELGKVVIIS